MISFILSRSGPCLSLSQSQNCNAGEYRLKKMYQIAMIVLELIIFVMYTYGIKSRISSLMYSVNVELGVKRSAS